MEGKIDVNANLDYAFFRISSTQNRYEAVVCSRGRTEKLADGCLDQLALHLPEAKGFQSNSPSGTFTLHIGENNVSWFTKATLARFFHIVNSPEVLKSSNAMLSEMSQLEETRKFHLALYLKDRPTHLGSGLTGGFLQDMMLAQQVNVDTVSSDPTKNELLRALDLRLLTLKEEIMVSLNRAAGSNLSMKEISDLSAFAEHFRALDLRNSLLKYLAMISNCQSSETSDQPSVVSRDLNEKCGSATDSFQLKPQTGILYSASNSVSPAKLAQVERDSSSESEESADLSNDDQAVVERSRPIIRSASPRRSASPMRRVQIGRSGSRRSTALTIKSLNHFPARDRIFLNRDADENNSCTEEPEQPSKKTESTVRRMSVQDAINLFESKQKDQNLDVQKRKASGDAATNLNKTVLRRWSAGMGDSFNRSQESTSNTASLNTSIDLVPEEEKNIVEVMVSSDPQPSNSALPDDATHGDACGATPSVLDRMTSPPMSVSTYPIKPKPEENGDELTPSAEWNRQKEAELNQMLMKMMGSKPAKHRGTNATPNGLVDASAEQKGDFYSQYREKRDEKLRSENVGKRAAKEAQFKVLHETLEKSKADMVKKTGGAIEKHVSPIRSQRPRRNSSPPVLPKKDVSKTPASRKASSKLSPLPASRSSGSSGPSPKTNGSQVTKSIPRTISTNTPPNQRKKQPAPTQPSPRTERPLQQQKNKKGTVTGSKEEPKGQEEKKLKPVTTKTRRLKTGNSPDLGDESDLTTTKPSFYSKVTKKSSVVPLESKPFLRKGAGTSPGIGPGLSKSKASQPVDSPKGSESLTLAEDTESTVVTTESTSKVLEVDLAQPENDVDTNLEISLDIDLNIERTENLEQSLAAVDNGINKLVEPPTAEIQPDEDMDISSTAWVEVDHQEIPTACERGQMTDAASPGIAPISSSSPRIHHSLSQMLQADSSELEIIEWGNAENPPALVYQKDAPKGLKRFLKFARKSKGDANVTGWASPSAFSEGEDDQEDSKGANKKSLDLLSKKVALHAKGYGQSFDSGNSSKRAVDWHKMQSILSAQSSTSNLSSLSDKLQEGHGSVTANSTKTTRPFSFLTFRSSKSSDSKHR